MRFVVAGHPPPLLPRGTRVLGQLDPAVNVPLGLGIDAAVNEVTIEVGDRALLFTDGVIEDGPGDPLGDGPKADPRRARARQAAAGTATLLLLGWPAAQPQ